MKQAGAVQSDAAAAAVPFLHPHIAHAKGLRGMVRGVDTESAEQTSFHTAQILDSWHSFPNVSLLRIDVSDTGIGIPKEQFDSLFKPFSQADDTPSRQFGGIGLGLSIVKGLVQILGGDVLASSTPGRGSTFSVVIPMKPS